MLGDVNARYLTFTPLMSVGFPGNFRHSMSNSNPGLAGSVVVCLARDVQVHKTALDAASLSDRGRRISVYPTPAGEDGKWMAIPVAPGSDAAAVEAVTGIAPIAGVPTARAKPKVRMWNTFTDYPWCRV